MVGPLYQDVTDAEVKRILSLPALQILNKEKSSVITRLEKILKIHARVMRYEPKGIVIREGDYGNSAFFVLSGEVGVVLAYHPRVWAEELSIRKISGKPCRNFGAIPRSPKKGIFRDMALKPCVKGKMAIARPPNPYFSRIFQGYLIPKNQCS